MKRTLFVTLLIFTFSLASCALKDPVQSIELVIVDMDRTTNTAQFELRNNSSSDVEYAVNDFISTPERTQKVPQVKGLVFGANKKTLKSGEIVKLSWDDVYNDFPIGVFVYHKSNTKPEIIWTRNTPFALD